VLLADSDADQHALCAIYFPVAGLELVHAYTRDECLAAVREWRPPAILLGMETRGEFRPDIIAELRRLGVDPTRSVLVITADFSLERHVAGLGEEVAGVIVKPFGIVELAERVRQLAMEARAN
jgi:DNA-binding response OmpR family regulator